ncbi:MAG: class I SAM-dependent methyltransferase [Leptolyngbyaceae cyanobacterium]
MGRLFHGLASCGSVLLCLGIAGILGMTMLGAPGRCDPLLWSSTSAFPPEPIGFATQIEEPVLAAVTSRGLDSPYRDRDRPSADGIGKVYMGREIAQVMGYRGAAWLERPSRLQSEKPHLLIANLDLQPDQVVADLGAGTGYLSARLAAKVPQGKVFAVDVQPEMITLLQQRIEGQQLENVEPILATVDDPKLPESSVDLAIMVDVYHELEYPYEVMQQVVKALRPGGRVVLVEYRGENPFIMIKRLHKMTEKQARRELAAVGLKWVKTNEDLPTQHIMVFEKPREVA